MGRSLALDLKWAWEALEDQTVEEALDDQMDWDSLAVFLDRKGG